MKNIYKDNSFRYIAVRVNKDGNKYPIAYFEDYDDALFFKEQIDNIKDYNNKKIQPVEIINI